MKLRLRVSSRLLIEAWTVGFLFVLISISNAWAWGRDGHRIIAEISEQYLEPTTAKQVRDLLALENVTTLADISTWADYIRLQRRDTAPWHYVNIPIHPQPGTPAAYNAERDCGHDNCIVAKTSMFEGVLGDKNAPPIQRLEALKFIVHFVADIHQPLHCSDNNDGGGNGILVEFDGRPANLHWVWDTGILAPAIFADERDYARRLVKSINQEELSNWREGSLVDWVNESYRMSVNLIYKHLPSETVVLSESYGRDMLPVVDGQLERAGVRLATVLNVILGAH